MTRLKLSFATEHGRGRIRLRSNSMHKCKYRGKREILMIYLGAREYSYLFVQPFPCRSRGGVGIVPIVSPAKPPSTPLQREARSFNKSIKPWLKTRVTFREHAFAWLGGRLQRVTEALPSPTSRLTVVSKIQNGPLTLKTCNTGPLRTYSWLMQLLDIAVRSAHKAVKRYRRTTLRAAKVSGIYSKRID